MTNPNLESLLQQVFQRCEEIGQPLTTVQQQLLFQMIGDWLAERLEERSPNPLAQLTPEQRSDLLQFIQDQQMLQQDWKTSLMNDWLQSRESGKVQFLRERYGIEWLRSVSDEDIATYLDEDSIRLKIGDRIEICNALWEWVQDDGPCSREWFPCRVIGLTESTNSIGEPTLSATVRFQNGNEFEIQGLYEWNRTNWRLAIDQTT